MITVTADDNAPINNKFEVKLWYSSWLTYSGLKRKNSSTIASIIITMGKCNNSGCILPKDCSQCGSTSKFSNSNKKMMKIFSVNKTLPAKPLRLLFICYGSVRLLAYSFKKQILLITIYNH